MTCFDAPEEKHFENIVERGEDAVDQDCLLFPQCLLHYER